MISPSKANASKSYIKLVMGQIAFGNAEWDFRAWLFHGSVHRNVDAPFEFADVVGIVVDALAVAGAEVFLERAKLMRDRIENAGVLLSSA